MVHKPYFLFLLLALGACSGDKNAAEAAAEANFVTGAASAKESSKSGPDYLTAVGDSLQLPPFTIEVQLSDKATEKLTALKETILVDATFIGIPGDTISNGYEESGEVTLTRRTLELQQVGAARFEGIKFARSPHDALADKDVRVLINVYSGRRSSEDNLLDVGILEEKMSKVKNRRFILRGKLIGED